MKKAFTLIEVLMVLFIIALGWLWLPSLINPTSTQTQSRFEGLLEELAAKARAEAIARVRISALAINAEGTFLSVGIFASDGSLEVLEQLEIPRGIVFDATLSSGDGTPGILDFASSSDGIWRVWRFDSLGRACDDKGQPKKGLGALFFNTPIGESKWRISNEGALLETP